MVDYCSVAAAPKFFNGRSHFRDLSSSATSADGGDAPLNLCIKSEPQTAVKQEYCQSIEHEKQQAGRLKIFGRGGQRFSGCNENEEHSNQRHSSGESMDSGIYIARHYSGDNSNNGMFQYHASEQAITTGNSVDSGIFIQRNFGGGIEGQRHDSGGSNGSSDSCQELGNLLIVSALDTDIANEEIVECEENVIMEEYDDNLIIDDNAGGCERMDETGNNSIARESKPGAQDLAIRMVTVNKEYNNKNKNIPRKLEYLQGEGGQLRYAEPDNSVQQLAADNCIQRPYSVEESSQDSLEILATAASAERAATIRRTMSEPARVAPTPAELAVSLADGPLHLLAAIAISAKANTNLSQLPASSISSASSFTTSSTNHKNQKSSARHKETASSINTTLEDQDESPAAAVASAKRLRYHSWPQMATMTSSQRKKEQNKLASKRFRERKKHQMEQARVEITELEVRNDLLRKKEEYMRSELENLRRVLLERNLIKIVQLPDGQTQVIATGIVKKSFTTKLK